MRVFLSWCHRDEDAKTALIDDLLPALSLYRDLDIDWWEDSHLTCGEELTESILARLDECDAGLLLLSTRYFSRPFIRRHELTRFAGPTADRISLPVALSPLPGRGTQYDVGGVERQLVFTREGRSFTETRGPGRTRFVNELADAIRRRLLGENGYRSL